MRPRTLGFVVLAVLAVVPGWTGFERLSLFKGPPVMTATRVALDPADPTRRRLGRLTFMGGVRLASPDAAFGGFSALAVRGDRVTLLNDGGNVVRFRLRSDGRPTELRFLPLPAGPGAGWRKFDRDSEGLAIDPATGTAWVSFERADAIWRYAPDFVGAEASARPTPMAGWPENGGAEALARLPDGGFVVLQERANDRGPTRVGLVWAGDPTLSPEPDFRFRYLPPAGYSPVGAAALPDGRLLVLSRWYAVPPRFANVLEVVAADAIRPGAVVRGREVGRLAAPLIHDNFEGVAVTVERGRFVIWLVSDDNHSPLQRSLLLKFRLD